MAAGDFADHPGMDEHLTLQQQGRQTRQADAQIQAASIRASSGDRVDAPVVVLRPALRSPARGHCTVLLMLNPP